MVAVGIVAVSGGGCASRSDISLGVRSTTSTSTSTTSTTTTSTVATTPVPTTRQPTTTAASTTTLAPTTEPPTTEPALVPGGSCVLGSHPDCIDPDGDGAGAYLLFGADCLAGFPDAPELCSDLDRDGIAGYPDSG